MTKEIPITSEMKAAIARVNDGSNIDFDQIAVFEARSLNTRPLRRKSGIYAGAVTSKSTLDAMVAALNSSNEGVPLHIMHNTELLNIGKLFQARIDQANDGAWELSTQFYIPREFAETVAKLNTGVVDQVSVGILSETLNCSACGYDYLKGSMENIYLNQCPKKHAIGVNGVHTVLNGLTSWGEMSLVDKGAATDARIASADKSKFTTRDNVYRLAAGHNQNDLATSVPLIANLEEISGEEINQVDKAEIAEIMKATLKESNDAHSAALAELQTKLDAALADKAKAETAQTTAEASVATLTAERDSARTERDGVKAELAEATTYLTDQAKKAQVAAGSKAPKEPANFKEAVALIDESGVNLVNLFARDRSSELETKKVTLAPSLKAFMRQGETK